LRFEWDDAKAAANLRKQWVSFEEAAEVFYDPNSVSGDDVRHSHDEARFFIVGYSSRRVLFVTFTERQRLDSSHLGTRANAVGTEVI